MMSLDDGAADGEPDSHAVALRRVEGVEQPVHALTVDAHARVPDGHAHTIARLPFCSDQQLPRAILHVDHRVRGVAEQIQDDLLELDAIAGDRGEVVGELRLQHHPVSLKITRGQRNDLSRGVVQIHRFERELPLAEQRTQPRDHIRRAVAIANRPPRRFASAIEVWRIRTQHPQTRAGVGDDAESGWLTSWAIEAVNALTVVTRATWASSDRALFSASSATLLSVTSCRAPMNIGDPRPARPRGQRRAHASRCHAGSRFGMRKSTFSPFMARAIRIRTRQVVGVD